MTRESFSFNNGFNFKEFKDLCKLFSEVKLYKFVKSDLLLTDYIFCLAMKRIFIDKKSILKRLLASIFNFQVQSYTIGTGENAFVFTGDKYMRPDYLRSIENVAREAKDASLFLIDRKSIKFSIKNILRFPIIFIWANKLSVIVDDKWISLDMAVSVFRSVNQANLFIKDIKKLKSERIVTFCDQWSIENAITQIAKIQGYKTATLQHGNGKEIFAGFCSDFYLANSVLSKNNAIKCGVPKEQIVMVGPMKYAGKEYQYFEKNLFSKIGIIFDGLDNFKSNLAMLKVAHNLAKKIGVECYIRLHPSNNIADYKQYISKYDIICDNLNEFETVPDFYIVYISTMYTDMIYRKKVVFRYITENSYMYSDLNDITFSNEEELENLIIQARSNYRKVVQNQMSIRKDIYGEDEGMNKYQKFFEYWEGI